MSSGAPPEAACQLDSRYWKITTSDGNVEEVQGPGVVGTLLASHAASCLFLITLFMSNVWNSSPVRQREADRDCLCAQESFPSWRRGKSTSTRAAPPSPRRQSTWRATTPSTGWVTSAHCSKLCLCAAAGLMFVSLVANKEEVFHVAIPRFHMVCPPFREPPGRTVSDYHTTSRQLVKIVQSSFNKLLPWHRPDEGSSQFIIIWSFDFHELKSSKWGKKAWNIWLNVERVQNLWKIHCLD